MEWKQIVSALTKPNLVKDILNYDARKLKNKIKKQLKKNYFTHSDWTKKRVYSGFKTAVPLFLWVNSTTIYKDILDKVQPLTDEINKLKKEEEEMVTKSENNKKQLETI